MAYDRFDDSRRWRERSPRDEDRGFFDRAGDEIASWFGDDDAERRRQMDRRWDEDRRPATGQGDWDRSPRYPGEGYRRPYTGRFSGSRENLGRDAGDRFGPDRAYQNDRFDRGSSQRDYYGVPTSQRDHDPHYGEWRQRQIDALDRDYDEYRRERQGAFESDFGSWRTSRQSKRDLLGSVREHMDVVGSDEVHVGTVDKVRGDQIVLTKADSADQHHHRIGCSLVDRIEENRVFLNLTGAQALAKAEESHRGRFLFEDRDRDRDEGPHMLNRSFSGTY